jgi:hypothetical protein
MAVSILLFLGAGCVALPFGKQAVEYEAEALDLPLGSSFDLSQGISAWGIGGAPLVKHVTVEEHQAGKYAVLSWAMDVKRETEASKSAREYAMTHAPVGEDVKIPEPVLEGVSEKGVVSSHSLDNAERILLPTYWPEGEIDVSESSNSLLWLSKAQYDELATTRASHIQLGLFDSTLKGVIDFSDSAKSALDRLQGKIAEQPTSNKDFTKLTASGNFGSAVIQLNGTDVKVKTLEASNAFAHYSILANPDNPIILKVTMLPWALGPQMFFSLTELKEVLGYSITSVYQPSENPLEHPVPDNASGQ